MALTNQLDKTKIGLILKRKTVERERRTGKERRRGRGREEEEKRGRRREAKIKNKKRYGTIWCCMDFLSRYIFVLVLGFDKNPRFLEVGLSKALGLV